MNIYNNVYEVTTVCCLQKKIGLAFFVFEDFPLISFFSSPEQRSRRAIVLPLVSASVSTNVKGFHQSF